MIVVLGPAVMMIEGNGYIWRLVLIVAQVVVVLGSVQQVKLNLNHVVTVEPKPKPVKATANGALGVLVPDKVPVLLAKPSLVMEIVVPEHVKTIVNGGHVLITPLALTHLAVARPARIVI